MILVTGINFDVHFDRNTRLRFCNTQWPSNFCFFAHDGGKVLEQTWVTGSIHHWKDQTVLPMSTGTAKIMQNFIVLHWAADPDYIDSGIHLFSTDTEGMLWDYLVGTATGVSMSLVDTDNSHGPIATVV